MGRDVKGYTKAIITEKKSKCGNIYYNVTLSKRNKKEDTAQEASEVKVSKRKTKTVNEVTMSPK